MTTIQAIPLSDKALQTVALTVYGEARGETLAGKIGVAWVIRNRVDHPRWWGRGVEQVCLYPWQFSCWRPDDPNCKLLHDPEKLKDDTAFLICESMVEGVFGGHLPDLTYTADHYLATSIAERTDWANHAMPTAIIGGHSFYRLEL